MSGQPPGRLRAAVDLLRPRTFFRTLSRVDSLVDTTRDLTAAVDALRIRTDQLLTIQRLDWDQRGELAEMRHWLDAGRIEKHVAQVVEAATLARDPFPHTIVEPLLPADVYEHIRDAVPPSVFFQGGRDEHWAVPSGVAPLYSRQVWSFVANTLAGDILYKALNAKFGPVIREYVRTFCPTLPDDADLSLYPSDGRIMLRRPGYDLQPHRDPKWGFVTALMYLAHPGDSEEFGTQLYRVREDPEATSGAVHYLERAQCELVRTVPFRANSMLVFLNSVGAHGAFIPSDAQPATLERYLYQFRLGPTTKVISRLVSLMPPDKAALWSGSKTGRLPGYR
ncbi:MAG: hypothetical protein ABL986_06720 [Vicinamibacterales bacterium]